LSVRHLLVPALLLALSVSGGCEAKKERTGETRLTEDQGVAETPQVPLAAPGARRPAPDIRSTGVDGQPWSLADRKGHVVLVDFWATWCPPCRKTIPHLIEMQTEFGGRGLEIVGMSLDQGGSAIVAPFMQQAGINYPIVIDKGGKWTNLFGGVEGIPTFFLIDRDGRIAGRVTGAVPKESMVQAVEALLKER